MGVSHRLSFGSIIDREWSRISLRRYASLLAVGISNLTAQTAYPIAMTWGCAPYCAFAVWLLTQLGAPGIPASQSYCMATTIILLHLHHAATAMGTTTPLPFEFSTTQHSAVHFALSFFVLSELEYHRGWIFYQRSKGHRISLLAIIAAGNDPKYNLLRECLGYNFASPHVIGNTASEHLKHFFSTRTLGTIVFSSTLFHLVGGCINYPVKLLFNPGPDPYAAIEFLRASAQFNVLFESYNVFIVFFNICVTQRVMRHANFIVFWGVVKTLKHAGYWRNGGDTVAKDIELLPCSTK